MVMTSPSISQASIAAASASMPLATSGTCSASRTVAAAARTHLHFAKSGLLRVNERLGEGEMDKVRAARRFTVVTNVPQAPRYCHRYDTRHLTIRRTIHNQAVWFQSGSVFGS